MAEKCMLLRFRRVPTGWEDISFSYCMHSSDENLLAETAGQIRVMPWERGALMPQTLWDCAAGLFRWAADGWLLEGSGEHLLLRRRRWQRRRRTSRRGTSEKSWRYEKPAYKNLRGKWKWMEPWMVVMWLQLHRTTFEVWVDRIDSKNVFCWF